MAHGRYSDPISYSSVKGGSNLGSTIRTESHVGGDAGSEDSGKGHDDWEY
jgi:hypothetical protein